MKVLALFAMSGYFYNDVLVLISILGSSVLFITAFPHSPFERLIGLAEWSSAPIVFGTLFQVCLILTGVAAETESIGVLVPMTTDLVSGLFALSWVLLGSRWWLRRSGFKTG